MAKLCQRKSTNYTRKSDGSFVVCAKLPSFFVVCKNLLRKEKMEDFF